jgi:hypothetical protein
MNLKLIAHIESCPTCSADIVAESCRSVHTCGDGFEEREFACGCIVSWSPNFNRIEWKQDCPNTQAARDKKIKRANLVNLLKEQIANSDVDDGFKNLVTSYIPSVR